MSFERQHDDLTVVLTRDRAGRIIKADMGHTGPGTEQEEALQLSAFQLYALVDDVAVADPEEWARRFDPRNAIERHLRQVADYFRERAEHNRDVADVGMDPGMKAVYRAVADTFDLAVTRVMEEIEALYPDHDAIVVEQERHPVAYVQRYHERS